MRVAQLGVAWVLLAAGCQAKDGEVLARVCRKAGEKIESLAGQDGGTLAGSLHGSAGEASLSARVHNRIRWDRYLAGVELRVRTTAAGTVRLEGRVADLSVKQRILDLARSTTGVRQVEDRLTLPGDE
jgi:osmotically-inducible protein OsmY